jgi:hypothetical protein
VWFERGFNSCLGSKHSTAELHPLAGAAIMNIVLSAVKSYHLPAPVSSYRLIPTSLYRVLDFSGSNYCD